MTEEDEAFDEIARKQGMWGGGFMAKRAMAADKVQDETDMLTIAYLHGYDKGKKAALAQPAQEPVARVTGVYGGQFTYEPINPAMILPIGMALYAAPKGNT